MPSLTVTESCNFCLLALQLSRQMEQTLEQKLEYEMRQAKREERMADIQAEKEKERRYRMERNNEVRACMTGWVCSVTRSVHVGMHGHMRATLLFVWPQLEMHRRARLEAAARLEEEMRNTARMKVQAVEEKVVRVWAWDTCTHEQSSDCRAHLHMYGSAPRVDGCIMMRMSEVHCAACSMESPALNSASQ